MAQISSNNGFRQSVSPPARTVGGKDVGKEEALQMEAEALDKLRRDRRLLGGQGNTFIRAHQKATALGKQDHDLMVFPEVDVKTRVGKSLHSIDLENLPLAELEKLLLDDSFEVVPKPQTLPQTQAVTPVVSAQCFVTPSFQSSQWTSPLHATVPRPLQPTFSSLYPKCSDPFQNGFNPNMSVMQRRGPMYLSLPAHAPYVSYPFPTRSAFQVRGTLPAYPSKVSSDMAKLLDKIARTSESLRNGNSSQEPCAAQTQVSDPPVQIAENTADISKFDWLDLDPLSKPRVDNVDLPIRAPESEPAPCGPAGEDPWDAVLQDEKPLRATHSERKVNGRSPSGATVTRSHSLNLRSAHMHQSKTPVMEVSALPHARFPNVFSVP